jgi:hypothetical protein
MHVEFEWEGPGAYYLIPARVRSGDNWGRSPIHVSNTANIQDILDEVTHWEQSTWVEDDPIWREGAIIYRDEAKSPGYYYDPKGPRL